MIPAIESTEDVLVHIPSAYTDADEIYNFLAGKGAVTGDVVGPAISPGDWGELK